MTTSPDLDTKSNPRCDRLAASLARYDSLWSLPNYPLTNDHGISRQVAPPQLTAEQVAVTC
jgi:hypothetical protein